MAITYGMLSAVSENVGENSEVSLLTLPRRPGRFDLGFRGVAALGVFALQLNGFGARRVHWRRRITADPDHSGLARTLHVRAAPDRVWAQREAGLSERILKGYRSAP